MASAILSDTGVAFSSQLPAFVQPGTLTIDSMYVGMQPSQCFVLVYVQQVPAPASTWDPGHVDWYAHDNVPCSYYYSDWPSQGAINQQTLPMVGEEAPFDLRGQVWALSRTAEGSRDVQQALDDTNSDHLRAAVASELRTHVWQAIKCRHAHHVLQKCIETMRREDFQFIINELFHTDGPMGVGAAARHRYGCRVLQRLFEHCSPTQLEVIVEHLLSDAVELCKHTWGVYVMQHLFEHGTESQIAKLSQILTKHTAMLSADELAPSVFSKAFTHASSEHCIALAHALIAQPGLLITMGCLRHGHVAAKEALDLVDHHARLGAIANLSSQMHKLKSTRYGRRLAEFVEKDIVN